MEPRSGRAAADGQPDLPPNPSEAIPNPDPKAEPNPTQAGADPQPPVATNPPQATPDGDPVEGPEAHQADAHAQSIVAPHPPQRRNKSIISDDEDEDDPDLDHNGAKGLRKRKAVKGGRPKSVFMTWSNTGNPQYSKPAYFSRKEFARAIESACLKVNVEPEAMAIFWESHKDAGARYHALVIFESRSSRAWEMDAQMFQLRRAKTYTEIVIGESQKPHLRILEYLMSPTPNKLVVDDAPYFAKNIATPDHLWGKSAKDRTKMGNTQSSLDEIYAYLVGNPKIKSYGNLAPVGYKFYFWISRNNQI